MEISIDFHRFPMFWSIDLQCWVACPKEVTSNALVNACKAGHWLQGLELLEAAVVTYVACNGLLSACGGSWALGLVDGFPPIPT